MDMTMDTFAPLLTEADRLLQENPSAEQVIVLETATGNRYHCINHAVMTGDIKDEDSFLEVLEKAWDTTACYLVCLWNPANCMQSDFYPVDLPSFHLRQKLLTLSPLNAQTLILLLGESGYNCKKLGMTMPSSQ